MLHTAIYSQHFVNWCNICNIQKSVSKGFFSSKITNKNWKKDTGSVKRFGYANGYTHINVIVNLFTNKLTFLEPVKGVTALTLANNVRKFWSYYGHTDVIISDQGPES